MKRRYTYDMCVYDEDLHGRCGGTGGTNLSEIRKAHLIFIKNQPMSVTLIIRRPDNKLVNFYHPYSLIEGIPK